MTTVNAPIGTKTKVSLSVHGRDVNPDALSLALALVPEASRFPSVETEREERQGGWCSFSSHEGVVAEAGFDAHADWLLDRLEPHVGLLRSWQSQGWVVRMKVITVVEGYAGGPLVKPETLRRFGQLGVEIRWLTACAHQRPPLSDAHGEDGGVAG